MTIKDLMKVDGFKEKMATKIYNSIQKQIEKIIISKNSISI